MISRAVLSSNLCRRRVSFPRYDENPNCAYDTTRLNVAIHVRMGDRREYQDGNLDYFQLLDLFMSTFSQEVVGKGLESPLFHVFSETLVPCPSGETGFFDEFPTWPVELDQVSEDAAFFLTTFAHMLYIRVQLLPTRGSRVDELIHPRPKCDI